MKHCARQLGGSVLIALVLTGCASVPAPDGFHEVSDTVATRIDKRVHWYQGGSEDAAVTEGIRSLLNDDLTVDEAVQIALLNNRMLQATYEDLGLAQANLVQAGLLKNPIFDVAVFLPEGGGQADLDFAITQSFLSIIYRPLRRRIATAEHEAAKLRVTGAVLDLDAKVRAAYYRVQADHQLGEMLRQVVNATDASADAAERLREAGNITQLDVARERILFEESRLVLAQAQANLIVDREALIELMGLWGLDTQSWYVLPRLPDIPAGTLDSAELERLAIEANLDLPAYRYMIETAAERLGLANATALVPDLEIGLVAEREDGEWELGPAFAYELPMFDRGQGRKAVAQSDLRRAQHMYWALGVQIRAVTRAARQQLITARAQAEHLQSTLLPLSNHVVVRSQLQYNAMQFGVFQLLQAKRQQINTAMLYIETLRDYWLARTELEQILNGRLPDVGGMSMEMPGQLGMNRETGGH